jgi:hypothetical protein
MEIIEITKYVFKTAIDETVIAGINKGVYIDDKYKEIKKCLLSIDDTRLATKGTGKPEKLIGASGKKTIPTLEGFM